MIHSELQELKGTSSPCLRSFYTWLALQLSELVEEKARTGQPVSVTRATEVERVNNMITGDPYMSFIDVEPLSVIYRKTLQQIIHDQLNLRK